MVLYECKSKGFLRPQQSWTELCGRLAKPRPGQSTSSTLCSRLPISGTVTSGPRLFLIPQRSGRHRRFPRFPLLFWSTKGTMSNRRGMISALRITMCCTCVYKDKARLWHRIITAQPAVALDSHPSALPAQTGPLVPVPWPRHRSTRPH